MATFVIWNPDGRNPIKVSISVTSEACDVWGIDFSELVVMLQQQDASWHDPLDYLHFHNDILSLAWILASDRRRDPEARFTSTSGLRLIVEIRGGQDKKSVEWSAQGATLQVPLAAGSQPELVITIDRTDTRQPFTPDEERLVRELVVKIHQVVAAY